MKHGPSSFCSKKRRLYLGNSSFKRTWVISKTFRSEGISLNLPWESVYKYKQISDISHDGVHLDKIYLPITNKLHSYMLCSFYRCCLSVFKLFCEHNTQFWVTWSIVSWRHSPCKWGLMKCIKAALPQWELSCRARPALQVGRWVHGNFSPLGRAIPGVKTLLFHLFLILLSIKRFVFF